MIDSDYITENFKREEFACSCCGKDDIDYELVKKLQTLREIYGSPMAITSGVRCEQFNSKLPGSSKTSSHIAGKAADISVVNSAVRFRLIKLALEMGWKRVGIAGNFIHLDIDESKKQNIIWTYS